MLGFAIVVALVLPGHSLKLSPHASHVNIYQNGHKLREAHDRFTSRSRTVAEYDVRWREVENLSHRKIVVEYQP